MKIYCCTCEKKVRARLTNGVEIYPHRSDLKDIPFWKCDTCGNHVGCHHKTKSRTYPLGCIASIEIKKARSRIHKLLDPLWKDHGYKRRDLYKHISDKIGWEYHTAHLRTLEECRIVYRIILNIRQNGLGKEL